MTNRISQSNLESLVDTINRITKSPEKPYNENGANIGNFHLSYAYGGVTLHRMMNDGGGVTTPLGGGYFTKRELYEKLHTFITGLSYGQ